MRLPVTLFVKASPLLVVAVSLAHISAVLGLLASNPAPAVGVPLGIAIVVSLAVFYWRYLARPRVRSFTLQPDGHLVMEFLDGRQTEAATHPGSTVFPWLIVLRLRGERGLISFVLPPDALPPDGHRQLRLWLRWKAATA